MNPENRINRLFSAIGLYRLMLEATLKEILEESGKQMIETVRNEMELAPTQKEGKTIRDALIREV